MAGRLIDPTVARTDVRGRIFVNVAVDSDVVDALDTAARAAGVKRSDVVRLLLERGTDGWKRSNGGGA